MLRSDRPGGPIGADAPGTLRWCRRMFALSCRCSQVSSGIMPHMARARRVTNAVLSILHVAATSPPRAFKTQCMRLACGLMVGPQMRRRRPSCAHVHAARISRAQRIRGPRDCSIYGGLPPKREGQEMKHRAVNALLTRRRVCARVYKRAWAALRCSANARRSNVGPVNRSVSCRNIDAQTVHRHPPPVCSSARSPSIKTARHLQVPVGRGDGESTDLAIGRRETSKPQVVNLFSKTKHSSQ